VGGMGFFIILSLQLWHSGKAWIEFVTKSRILGVGRYDGGWGVNSFFNKKIKKAWF